MFPPPSPWKQPAPVDPDRAYVAVTSRFFLKSLWRVPAFMAAGYPITRQVAAAPGIVGWSLGMNLLSLEFFTLSAWDNDESLRHFVHGGSHGLVLRAFENDMRRKSIFVYYKVLGRELPLTWEDAIARQNRHDAPRQAKG